jgi:quinoprotein glucose dehydrogenase
MSIRTMSVLAAAAMLGATFGVQAQAPAANGTTVEWPVYGGSLAAQHYSPLEQINARNVKDLKIAWRWHAGNFGPTPEMKS